MKKFILGLVVVAQCASIFATTAYRPKDPFVADIMAEDISRSVERSEAAQAERVRKMRAQAERIKKDLLNAGEERAEFDRIRADVSGTEGMFSAVEDTEDFSSKRDNYMHVDMGFEDLKETFKKSYSDGIHSMMAMLYIWSKMNSRGQTFDAWIANIKNPVRKGRALFIKDMLVVANKALKETFSRPAPKDPDHATDHATDHSADADSDASSVSTAGSSRASGARRTRVVHAGT